MRGRLRNPGRLGRSFLQRFARAERGGIAMISAFLIPVVLLMSVGTIEMTTVMSDRRSTQSVADGAALMGAQQLGVTPSGAQDRAKAFALAQLSDISARSTVTVTATLVSAGVMKVAIDTHRMSFFANLMPPGGFYTHVEASAQAEGLSPLCVLGLSNADDVHTTGSSQLQAPACMVHGNRNVIADGGTTMAGSPVEAVGSAPAGGNSGAKAIPDPFVGINLTPPTTCNSESTDFGKAGGTLAAGLHCSDVNIGSKSTIIFAAGTHWFKGALNFDDKGSIDGTAGVTLVFLAGSSITTSDKDIKQNIALRGAKTGPLAGFVLATTRDNTTDFHFPSDAVSEITGTIYMPAARLMVDGTSKSGQTSPWTVVAVKGMAVNSSATVQVNANYAASDVPVPVGVGNKLGNTMLTK